MLVRVIHYGLIAAEKAAQAVGVDQTILDGLRGARKILGVWSGVEQLDRLRAQMTESANPNGGADGSLVADDGETG
ncbi:hypothetical protein GCM10009712_17240 [Pseudarthrobacter sulfonivorans]|jgi:hypothetical protein|uniref:hypothetical protein n=1 Tax=Pseudarthrobacter sulfonivorans TaxID=121292 RepID=UPI00168B2E1C|nr:hypothetical protein [Pseudarthrobacter sulfonivorans]